MRFVINYHEILFDVFTRNLFLLSTFQHDSLNILFSRVGGISLLLCCGLLDSVLWFGRNHDLRSVRGEYPTPFTSGMLPRDDCDTIFIWGLLRVLNTHGVVSYSGLRFVFRFRVPLPPPPRYDVSALDLQYYLQNLPNACLRR